MQYLHLTLWVYYSFYMKLSSVPGIINFFLVQFFFSWSVLISVFHDGGFPQMLVILSYHFVF